MDETIPPVSKSQPASPRDEDPHASVTIAPPAPSLDELLRQPTPIPHPALDNEPLQTALDAGARAGSSLTQLARMAAELSSGVMGARHANERLLAELTSLQALLTAASEQQEELERRVLELGRDLESATADAEQERRFLINEHDEFIKALLEEHEQALARAHAQRDEAQARAEKSERERDELRAEASQLRASLSAHRSASTLPPPPAASRRLPSFHAPPALRLDPKELDATLHTRPRRPTPASASPRRTVPPMELERALYQPPVVEETVQEFPRVSTRPGVGGPRPQEPPAPSFGPLPSGWTPPPPAPAEAVTVPPPRQRVISAASLPPVAMPGPVLKQKPDPSTRPLISYSVGEDEVKSETLEGVRLASKPPRR